MDWDRITSIGIAMLCMAAIGVSATTLDSTVSQTPDDVIDVDDWPLPLGDQSTSDIDRQIQANKQSQEDEGDASSDGEQAEEDRPAPDSNSEQEERKAKPGETGESQPNERPADSSERSSLGGSGDELVLGAFSQSLLQRLLALLEKLLPFLVALVLLALAYRYRERLLALLLAPLGVIETDGDVGQAGRDRDPWEDVTLADEVDRAWYEMVSRLDIERPWAKTPDECRRVAVEQGLDPAVVSTLTETFREKRYRGGEPSATHRERATWCREQLDQERHIR